MPVMSDPVPVPDLGRPDGGAVLVTFVDTEDAPGQAAVAKALTDRWRQARWPAGLLSLTCFASLDGQSLLAYAQWASGSLPQASPAGGDFIGGVAARLATGVRVHPSVEYRVHRSTVADGTTVPHFFAVDEFETPGPEATHAWLDRALALEAEAGAHAAPGAVSGHVHVSGDGRRMLNLSAWVSSAAHEEFLTGGALAEVFATLGPPGIPCAGNGYRLASSLTAGAPSSPS